MRQKDRSGRWTVPPTGHKKGGGIQDISTASVARAETLSDALGTRLPHSHNFNCIQAIRSASLVRYIALLLIQIDRSLYFKSIAKVANG